MTKIRLDILVKENQNLRSRTIAQNLIRVGLVKVNGTQILKPSTKFDNSVQIEINSLPKYTSRGGLKLESALNHFKIDIQNLIAIDVGASTGGFADCLLQRGAKHVYAIDVGHDQFDKSLANNPKITLLEKTDIRSVMTLPEKIDIAVIDVSFISLIMVLPSVEKLLKKNGRIIALIKPQFEVTKNNRKKGIVRDKHQRDLVVEKIKSWAIQNNWKIYGIIESPIKGGKGNIEYLTYLSKNKSTNNSNIFQKSLHD